MDKEGKRGLIRFAAIFLGSSCVSYTVDQIVKANVSPAGKIGAIAVKVGSMIISGMAASKAESYIRDTVDEAYKAIDGVNNVIEKANEAE